MQLSKLGIKTALISKIGGDPIGDEIAAGFCEPGAVVETKWLFRDTRAAAAFTYVIVDTTAGTRTCIHTPSSAQLQPAEVNASMLNDSTLLHLDTRHTTAAAALARLAFEHGIPVSLDIGKTRPGSATLFPFATHIITNATYPRELLQADDRADPEVPTKRDAEAHVTQVSATVDRAALAAATACARFFPRASTFITTLGELGAIAVRPIQEDTTDSHTPDSRVRCCKDICVEGKLFAVLHCPAAHLLREQVFTAKLKLCNKHTLHAETV